MAPSDRPYSARQGLTDRALSVGDAARGVALSKEIGWNQTLADWTYMLENGAGVGLSDDAGKLIASAMALPYGRFGWVCMVLVAPDWRRQGLATDLMNRVIALLIEKGTIPGLDATPAGREVYRHLGFKDIYGIERLVGEAVSLEAPVPAGIHLSPLRPEDMPAVNAYDAPRFGGNRSSLLDHLRERQPLRAHAAWTGSNLCGFALARDGQYWTQIGPVVADNDDIAAALVAAAAGDGTRLLIDSPAAQARTVAWLKAGGFEFQRPYTRMIHLQSAPLDRPKAIYALAGPELG